MKLRSFLLAGTFVPALALLPPVSITLPMSAAVAQAQTAPPEDPKKKPPATKPCRAAEAAGRCTAEACRAAGAPAGSCATAAAALLRHRHLDRQCAAAAPSLLRHRRRARSCATGCAEANCRAAAPHPSPSPYRRNLRPRRQRPTAAPPQARASCAGASRCSCAGHPPQDRRRPQPPAAAPTAAATGRCRARSTAARLAQRWDGRRPDGPGGPARSTAPAAPATAAPRRRAPAPAPADVAAPPARPFVHPGQPVPVAKPAVVPPPPAAARGPGGRPAAGAAAAPAAAAIAPVATPANVRRVDDVRAQRREIREGDRTIIREPGRTIIKEGNVTVIRRDESDRFRYGARNMIAERRGSELRTIAVRPDGTRIITVTDDSGRLMRRSRRDQFGREYVMFENRRSGMGTGTAIGIGVAAGIAAGLGVAYLANVPPPVVSIPPEQYIVDTRDAPPAMLYDTLAAPPVDVIERPYTLDEIRYTPALRQRMRSVDINTLTFDTGSFELRQDQYGQLEAIANAIRQVTDRPTPTRCS